MVKTVKNYQLGKIYKIVDNTNGNVYVGSTCKPLLSQRLSAHYQGYKTYIKPDKAYETKYVTSFQIIQNGDYYIELLELYPCTCNEELVARERYYIESMVCVNKVIPCRTKQEWNAIYVEKNKEHIAKTKKVYRESHKEIIAQNKKEYYQCNKEAIDKAKKEYNSEHKEMISKNKKAYYEANKEAILLKRKEYVAKKKQQKANNITKIEKV
jgi:hypothetical protein